jgi:hypothetical protein
MKNFKVFGAVLLLAALLAQFSCKTFSDKTALEKNRRLWNESRISNYRMTMEIMKTGHRTPMGTAVFEVRDQKAVSTTPATTGLQFACGVGNCERYETVEKIFAIIEDAVGRNPDRMKVEYDGQYGYPKTLNLDFNSRAMDDELSVKILQFEVLE